MFMRDSEDFILAVLRKEYNLLYHTSITLANSVVHSAQLTAWKIGKGGFLVLGAKLSSG